MLRMVSQPSNPGQHDIPSALHRDCRLDGSPRKSLQSKAIESRLRALCRPCRGEAATLTGICQNGSIAGAVVRFLPKANRPVRIRPIR
jgi:hypothetical protein